MTLEDSTMLVLLLDFDLSQGQLRDFDWSLPLEMVYQSSGRTWMGQQRRSNGSTSSRSYTGSSSGRSLWHPITRPPNNGPGRRWSRQDRLDRSIVSHLFLGSSTTKKKEKRGNFSIDGHTIFDTLLSSSLLDSCWITSISSIAWIQTLAESRIVDLSRKTLLRKIKIRI